MAFNNILDEVINYGRQLFNTDIDPKNENVQQFFQEVVNDQQKNIIKKYNVGEQELYDVVLQSAYNLCYSKLEDNVNKRNTQNGDNVKIEDALHSLSFNKSFIHFIESQNSKFKGSEFLENIKYNKKIQEFRKILSNSSAFVDDPEYFYAIKHGFPNQDIENLNPSKIRVPELTKEQKAIITYNDSEHRELLGRKPTEHEIKAVLDGVYNKIFESNTGRNRKIIQAVFTREIKKLIKQREEEINQEVEESVYDLKEKLQKDASQLEKDQANIADIKEKFESSNINILAKVSRSFSRKSEAIGKKIEQFKEEMEDIKTLLNNIHKHKNTLSLQSKNIGAKIENLKKINTKKKYNEELKKINKELENNTKRISVDKTMPSIFTIEERKKELDKILEGSILYLSKCSKKLDKKLSNFNRTKEMLDRCNSIVKEQISRFKKSSSKFEDYLIDLNLVQGDDTSKKYFSKTLKPINTELQKLSDKLLGELNSLEAINLQRKDELSDLKKKIDEKRIEKSSSKSKYNTKVTELLNKVTIRLGGNDKLTPEQEDLIHYDGYKWNINM